MERTSPRRFAIVILTTLFVVVLAFITKKDEQAPVPVLYAPQVTSPNHSASVIPIPPPPVLPPERVALGEKLFRDTQLSADNTVACIHCHDLKRGGVDRKRVSIGIGGAAGDINAPTVFNASLNFAQFWNGRANTLEEQAAGPIHNPLEMASNWSIILPKLRADKDYVAAFSAAYPDGITPDNILNAIASFERTLITPNAPFDRYLRNEISLNPDAIKGFRRFHELGCTSCHQGALLGGNMYQKFGVLRDYYKDKKTSQSDLGRYNVTHREEDRHVFKVPGLRNVELTPPYFHDGSANSLEEAILVMARYQLGQEIDAQEVRQIAAFLRSLTGQWRGQPLE